MCQYVRVSFSCHDLVFKVNPCAQYDEAHAHDFPEPAVPWYSENQGTVHDSYQFGEYPKYLTATLAD